MIENYETDVAVAPGPSKNSSEPEMVSKLDSRVLERILAGVQEQLIQEERHHKEVMEPLHGFQIGFSALQIASQDQDKSRGGTDM